MLLLTWMSSCKKAVEIPDSKNQIDAKAVFSDSTLSTAALLSVYSLFAINIHNGSKFLSLYGDDCIHTAPGTGTSLLQFNQSVLSTNNPDNAALWAALYSAIYQSNALIAAMESPIGVSKGTAEQLSAEARFLRAFAYLYLVQLYDHVPLILSTEVEINRTAGQANRDEVIEQVIADLSLAKAVLPVTYTGNGKVRANKWAAVALLSRAFLLKEDWIGAETESDQIISSGNYLPLPKPEDVFLAGSKEAILQFWNQNGFIADATAVLPSSVSVVPPYVVRPETLSSFENSDGRKSKWIGTNINASLAYNYPAKYRNRAIGSTRPEYVTALRISEQFLIRAEARAHLNKGLEAIADLNIIRARAGLSPLPSTLSTQETLEAVARERKTELLGEWGHRFFDLKRWGIINTVMALIKPGWRSTARAFPIPLNETIYNNNLIQNEGY